MRYDSAVRFFLAKPIRAEKSAGFDNERGHLSTAYKACSSLQKLVGFL